VPNHSAFKKRNQFGVSRLCEACQRIKNDSAAILSAGKGLRAFALKVASQWQNKKGELPSLGDSPVERPFDLMNFA
jgi:hypothetical protein